METTDSTRQRIRWLLAEFAVIVIGILVALLLDAWVASVADRRLEREYLGRLEQEVGNHLLELEYIEQVSGLAFAYADSLLRPDFVQSADDSRLVAALVWAGNQRIPDLTRSTFQELVSSGRLRVIRSTKVRTALAEYDRVLTEGHGFWDHNPPEFSRWRTARLPSDVWQSFADRCTTREINRTPLRGPCDVDLGDWNTAALRVELGAEHARHALRLQQRRVRAGGEVAGTFISRAAELLHEALLKR